MHGLAGEKNSNAQSIDCVRLVSIANLCTIININWQIFCRGMACTAVAPIQRTHLYGESMAARLSGVRCWTPLLIAESLSHRQSICALSCTNAGISATNNAQQTNYAVDMRSQIGYFTTGRNRRQSVLQWVCVCGRTKYEPMRKFIEQFDKQP